MNRLAWLWLPIAFFVTCAGWALASPVGSSPDDDYHLSSIWCAQGIRTGVCQPIDGDPNARAVPRAVVQAADCYRYDSSIPASCARTLPDSAALVATDRVNDVAGLYPSGFYRTMSLFVGPDVEASVTAMRMFNAALATLLLAAMLRLLPNRVGAGACLAICVTFVPLGFSLVASTNPSSWTIVGIAAYWPFALALLRRPTWRDRRGILITGALLVAAAMAIGSRVDASAYLVLATVIVMTIAGWRRSWGTPWRVGLLGVLCVLAAASYLGRGNVVAGGTGLGTAEAGGGLLLTNLAYLPTLVQGIVGGWSLGWNDTVMPPYVPVIGTMVIGALVFRGLQHPSRRVLVAAGLAAGALIAVPITFLQANGLGVGEVVQPRYLLPLLTLLMGVVALEPRLGSSPPLRRLPAIAIASALGVSGLLAFWANAHRYAAGTSVGLFDPKMTPAWSSATGLPLWLTTIGTAVATVVFVWGVVVSVNRPVRTH